jgi:hypothetical protein
MGKKNSHSSLRRSGGQEYELGVSRAMQESRFVSELEQIREQRRSD